MVCCQWVVKGLCLRWATCCFLVEVQQYWKEPSLSGLWACLFVRFVVREACAFQACRGVLFSVAFYGLVHGM